MKLLTEAKLKKLWKIIIKHKTSFLTSVTISICTRLFPQDYLRAVASHPTSDLVLTGSYDHTVRLWDRRNPDSAHPLVLDHGAPVESLLVFPSGSSCISAGGNYIKVWDLLSGGKLIAGFSNHQKTITSLGFDGTCQRLISGSLDR